MAGETQGWYLRLDAAKDSDATGLRIGAGLLTSNSVTITVTGGTAPYTYSWARVSGDVGPAISSTSAATVTWSETNSPVLTHTAVWRCTVTDSGNLSSTADVNVELAWE